MLCYKRFDFYRCKLCKKKKTEKTDFGWLAGNGGGDTAPTTNHRTISEAIYLPRFFCFNFSKKKKMFQLTYRFILVVFLRWKFTQSKISVQLNLVQSRQNMNFLLFVQILQEKVNNAKLRTHPLLYWSQMDATTGTKNSEIWCFQFYCCSIVFFRPNLL